MLFYLVFLPDAVFLLPLGKKLGRGSASAVTNIIGIHGDNQLGEFKKMRDVIRMPVADVLLDSFSHIHAGPFALDDDHRNAV